MPRDEWENDRRKRIAKKASRSVRHYGASSSDRRQQNAVHASRLQSPNTRFWFGKHNGLTVHEVCERDPNYIHWLIDSHTNEDNWRMNLLVTFLKEYMNE